MSNSNIRKESFCQHDIDLEVANLSLYYAYTNINPTGNRPHMLTFECFFKFIFNKPPWRNRLARSAVNRKVGGSSPPGGGMIFCIMIF